MAYYLGYKNNSDYNTIDLNGKCGQTLLGIVEYTCNFTNLEELKEELFNEGLIPDTNVELVYLIKTGKNKSYVKVPNLNRIYFSSSSSSFCIESIKQYLINNIRDKDLFIILYASYLKKIGGLDDIKEYLNKLLSRPGILSVTLRELANILNSPIISSIIEIILKTDNSEIKSKQIELLIRELSTSNRLLCLTFNYLNRHLNTSFSQVLESLKSITILQSKDYIDEKAIIDTINRFINYLISAVSKGTSAREKVHTRSIVDIGVIIQDYKEYCLAIESERYQEDRSSSHESNQGDDDYLEPADFERLGVDSDDYGIHLRISDSMRLSGGMNGY